MTGTESSALAFDGSSSRSVRFPCLNRALADARAGHAAPRSDRSTSLSNVTGDRRFRLLACRLPWLEESKATTHCRSIALRVFRPIRGAEDRVIAFGHAMCSGGAAMNLAGVRVLLVADEPAILDEWGATSPRRVQGHK